MNQSISWKKRVCAEMCQVAKISQQGTYEQCDRLIWWRFCYYHKDLYSCHNSPKGEGGMSKNRKCSICSGCLKTLNIYLYPNTKPDFICNCKNRCVLVQYVQ